MLDSSFDLDEAAAIGAPFPGLRPFEKGDSHVFFGRERQVQELLDRLGAHHFTAVIGSSGSGKSSLVRAGLVPGLHAGALAGEMSRWRVAVMRPGGAPIADLLEKLDEAFGPDDAAERRRLLQETTLGLLEATRRTLRTGEALLLVVDQFEDLFRAPPRDLAEDTFFVSLLLEATAPADSPVYVVLTMRSEYLGECSQFAGLPEAFNRSQYLVPRLGRAQLQRAIETPLSLLDVEMESGLVQAFLNEATREPDSLPAVQHALMRTYQAWEGAGRRGLLRFSHYDEAEGIRGKEGGERRPPLDVHGGELMQALPDRLHPLVARVFRCLTTIHNGRPARRATAFDVLCTVVGAGSEGPRDDVRQIVRCFAADGAHFLTVTPLERDGKGRLRLEAGHLVDLTHESLAVRWGTLARWVEQEAKSVACYLELVEEVGRGGGLWREPNVTWAEQFLAAGWTHEWSGHAVPRCPDRFVPVKDFIRRSRALVTSEQRERTMRRVRLATSLLGGALIVFFGFAIAAQWQLDVARESLHRAQETLAAAERVDHAKAVERERLSQREAMTDVGNAEWERLKAEVNALEAKKEASAQERLAKEREIERLLLQAKDKEDLEKQVLDLQQQLRAEQAKAQAAAAKQKNAEFELARLTAYWNDRAGALEKELQTRQLANQELKALARPPILVTVPQKSCVRLAEPLLGRVAWVALDDLGDDEEDIVEVFILLDPAPEPRPFTDDRKQSAAFIATLRPQMQPEGSWPKRSADGRVWCFRANRRATRASGGHRVGMLREGGQAYQVTAVRWEQNAQGLSDVITLLISPVLATTPSEKSAAKSAR